MQNLSITVDHLKCGGCANTIRKNVLEFEGVKKVSVKPETGQVDIEFEGAIDLNAIKNRLKELGYPETGTTEGLEKFGSNVKSYISCAIGRMTDDMQENEPAEETKNAN